MKITIAIAGLTDSQKTILVDMFAALLETTVNTLPQVIAGMEIVNLPDVTVAPDPTAN